MSDRISPKKALIGLALFISGSLLVSTSALAGSCPVYIADTALSGEVCEFDASNSITIASGGVSAGINQDTYHPASSFITNNGTITTATDIGINITSSSLTNGLTNNSVINITLPVAIFIGNTSTISGGIINTGSIVSNNDMGLQLDSDSTVNGNITNSGNITSNSVDNPAMLIRDTTVNGNVTNSGVMRAYGVGNGLLISTIGTGSIINGDILNSGTIRSGGSGIAINFSTVHGDITNNGTITSNDDDGINIVNSTAVDGDIINSGTISGDDNGITVDGSNTVNSIINQTDATISGDTGIYINDTSTVSGGIKNYGTITGSVNAIYVSADSTMGNINLYNGSRVIGAIDAVGATVNIVGDFATEGSMNVNAVGINASSTFNMANSITVQNAVSNAGTVVLGTAARTITGNYTQSTGSILELTVQNAATYGHLTVTGAVDLSQSGTIVMNIADGASLAIGNVFSDVISGGTLVAPTNGFNVTENNRFLNFSATVNGTGVDIVAVDDASTSVLQSIVATGNSGSAGAAQKLDDIMALNPGGDWQTVLSALYTLDNDQEITAAVNHTVPALTGATNAAIIETMGTASRIIQDRQESISGISTGGSPAEGNVWLKTFGSWGNQDTQDGVIGYDSKTYGLIAGADKVITDKASLGIGVSYANSDLNSPGDTNQVDVDSYLGMLYGSYNIDNRTAVDAQVTFGYNSSDTKRNITFGGLNRMAQGSYDGWNFHTGAGVGCLLTVARDTTFTPQVRFDYFAVGNESYRESGAGALNLYMDSQTNHQLIPALEVKANHQFMPGLSMALNAGIGYDLVNDRNMVSASFAGSGGVFITRGLQPSPWVIRSGAGVTWQHNDALDLTVRYDREDRGSGPDNQTWALKLGVWF